MSTIIALVYMLYLINKYDKKEHNKFSNHFGWAILTFDYFRNIYKHGVFYFSSSYSFRIPPYEPIWHARYFPVYTYFKLKASPNLIWIEASLKMRCFFISKLLDSKMSYNYYKTVSSIRFWTWSGRIYAYIRF